MTLSATSTESNSALYGTEGTTNNDVDSTTFSSDQNTNLDFAAPSGAALDMVMRIGVHGLGRRLLGRRLRDRTGLYAPADSLLGRTAQPSVGLHTEHERTGPLLTSATRVVCVPTQLQEPFSERYREQLAEAMVVQLSGASPGCGATFRDGACSAS